jgi:hypothetical protein
MSTGYGRGRGGRGAILAIFFATNLVYHVVLKPTEVFAPVSGTFNKTPELSKVLTNCKFIPEWKTGAALTQAKARVKDFLTKHTPARA